LFQAASPGSLGLRLWQNEEVSYPTLAKQSRGAIRETLILSGWESPYKRARGISGMLPKAENGRREEQGGPGRRIKAYKQVNMKTTLFVQIYDPLIKRQIQGLVEFNLDKTTTPSIIFRTIINTSPINILPR
jgi:hypothetical protein